MDWTTIRVCNYCKDSRDLHAMKRNEESKENEIEKTNNKWKGGEFKKKRNREEGKGTNKELKN